MRKLSFSGGVYKTWLRRYWVGSALMLLPFLLGALLVNRLLNNMLIYAQQEIDISLVAQLLFEFPLGAFSLIFVMLAAVVAAMLCFSYLHNSRSCVMLHSLPAKRESLFFSVVLAGLTLLLGPILLGSLLIMGATALAGVFAPGPAVLWALAMATMAIIMFSAGAFVAMLTGSVFAQGILTLLLVNLPLLLEGIVANYAERYIFGLAWGSYRTNVINPFAIIMGIFDNIVGRPGPFSIGFAPLLRLLVIIAAGVVFLLLAVVAYKKRNLEAAGDVIAARAIRPLFKYGATLLGAVYIGFFVISVSDTNNIATDILFSLIGGAIAYFGAEMLLNKTIKVFHRFKGLLVFSAAFAALLVVFSMDITGFGAYQLDAAQVEIIAIGDYNLDARATHAITGRAPQFDLMYTVADLDIDDPDGYLKDGWRRRYEPMPQAIADQIIQQDNTIFKGDEVDNIVHLQNLLAQNSKQLRLSQSIPHNEEGPGSSWQYYNIKIVARMENGKIFTRSYSFTMDSNQFPEISETYNRAKHQLEIARAQNLIAAANRGKYVEVNFHFDTGKNDPFVTLDKAQWTELLACYQKDMLNRDETAMARNIPQQWWPMGSIYLQLNGTDGLRVEFFADDTNTINWLIENGYLSQTQLDNYVTMMENEIAMMLKEQYDDVVKEESYGVIG